AARLAREDPATHAAEDRARQGAQLPARAVAAADPLPRRRPLAARQQPGGERDPALHRRPQALVVQPLRTRRHGGCQPLQLDRDRQGTRSRADAVPELRVQAAAERRLRRWLRSTATRELQPRGSLGAYLRLWS